MNKSKCSLGVLFFSLSLTVSASGLSESSDFIYDGVILTDIDHTIINPNFSTYVEFSEDDLAVKEYTGCSYDDGAFAWTYVHFNEPISRLSCD